MLQTVSKRKTHKKWVIICAGVLGAVLMTVLLIHIIRITGLSRAVKNLDIEEESTVIKVMKYGGRDKDTILDIVQKYYDAQMYTDSARLAIYARCVLDCEDALPLLQKALEKNGADKFYISQFENDFSMSDFEVITSYGSDGYGVADGIYCEFLGGYAKAKISGTVPIDIYAMPGGAVFLDSSDRFIKSITRDGSKINLETTQRASEFVYFGSHIYYIDENGQPHGPQTSELSEGEYTKNLYIEGNRVVCTVYGADGESLRTLTLNAID